FLDEMPALRKRVRVGAFLGNGRRAAQFWIDIRIPGKRLHNFLWITFVHNVSRLFLPRSIGISKLWLLRRETQCRCWEGTKCSASQNGEGKGEKFSHKERDLSSRSGRPATVFFRKRKIFHLTS